MYIVPQEFKYSRLVIFEYQCYVHGACMPCTDRLQTSLKFLPVVAGYRMDSFSFLSGPTIKTARAVRGMPALSISSGSSIPYLNQTETWLMYVC